jgi:hypothetical protein
MRRQAACRRPNKENVMRKTVIAALASLAALLGSGAAHAGNVYWSIGISAPPIGTVISNGPVYGPAPVYYEPAPVYYEPAPVYLPPPAVYRPVPRVVYAPSVVVGRPVPVVYGAWGHRHGAWGDRDRDGIPNYRDGHDNRRDWQRDGQRGDGWDRNEGRKYPHGDRR